MIVNQIKLVGLLENFGNMQALPDLRRYPGIFLITRRTNRMQPGVCKRVRCCKQGYIDIFLDQPLGQQGNNPFPWAIMPGRRSPGNRGKHNINFFLQLFCCFMQGRVKVLPGLKQSSELCLAYSVYSGEKIINDILLCYHKTSVPYVSFKCAMAGNFSIPLQ